MATEWHQAPGTLDQWVLVDANGAAVRHIVVLGPYMGDPRGAYFSVTGEGQEKTDHATLAEAMAAAEASLAERPPAE